MTEAVAGKNKRQSGPSRGYNSQRPMDDFETIPVSIRRVTKVNSGSKRMRFSVVVVTGNKKGLVGVGLGKGEDVRMAMSKATKAAKKNVIKVPVIGATIPHEIKVKLGAAKIFLKPALPGTGVIAGGAVRPVAELAGIKNLLSKVYGTSNQINNVYATIEAFKRLSESRVDGSFTVKPMKSAIEIITLASKDEKVRKSANYKKPTVAGERKVEKKAAVKPVKKAENTTKSDKEEMK